MTCGLVMMAGVKAERTIVKLAVTKKGHAALKSISERYGMKEYVAGGKLLDWFGQQDDIFQRAVLGLLEGLERDAAREFMRRLGEPVDVIVKTPGGKAKKSAEEPEKNRTHTPAQR